MGLDIMAYSEIKRADEAEALCEYGDIKDGYMRPYLNSHFPGRADEIEDRKPYTYGNEVGGFCPGSYRGYGQWRQRLAELAGYGHTEVVWNNPVPGPFMELINFSDCEGVIGTAIAKKLAKDFADYQEKADECSMLGFTSQYNEWRKVFELASDNGCVVFA